MPRIGAVAGPAWRGCWDAAAQVQGVEQTDELRRLGLRVEVRNGQVVVEREEAAPPRGD